MSLIINPEINIKEIARLAICLGILFHISIPGESLTSSQARTTSDERFLPNWPSLDSRPLPKWYDESKIGIFIHWGVFSVIGKTSEWFWHCWKEGEKECVDYMKQNYKPGFTYQEFAPGFSAEFFEPEEWAKLFQSSGARYIVLTSKHVDGYTLWPSATAFGWNSLDVGPKLDLVGALASAIRNKTSLHFGLYHSLYEWYNPLYMNDKKNNFSTDLFVTHKTMPELYELVKNYQPEIIWSDGQEEAPDSYWRATEFLAWLYNESPVRDYVVTNDRWGRNTMCHHGGFFTCADRYNPGALQPHKWENCLSLDKISWGYRKTANIHDYLTPEELITTIIQTVSCGGNVLVNVGPTSEGTIIPIQQERLLQMGEWLSVNGEAIYESVPWNVQNDTITPTVWYTSNPAQTRVYAMITKWPEDRGREVNLGGIDGRHVFQVTALGFNGTLDFNPICHSGGIRVKLPPRDQIITNWAWTIVFHMDN